MDFSIIVARAFAVYLLASGLFLVLRGKTLPLLLKDFFNHRAIMYLTGIILIFFGVVMLSNHFVWDSTWQGLLSLFGILALVKGLVYIFVSPAYLAKVIIKAVRGWTVPWGLIAMLLGLFLARVSF